MATYSFYDIGNKNLPRHDLLVHVIIEFASPVLDHDLPRPGEGVHEVPVPVVQVDAQILPEVRHAVLHVQVWTREVQRNIDWNLQNIGIIKGRITPKLILFLKIDPKIRTILTPDSSLYSMSGFRDTASWTRLWRHTANIWFFKFWLYSLIFLEIVLRKLISTW